MGLKEGLPDRPLTFDEFKKLQRQDALDGLTTLDKPGRIDVLFVEINGSETTLKYTEDEGWGVEEDEDPV